MSTTRTLLATVLLTALGLSTAFHAQSLANAAAEAARRSAIAKSKEAAKTAEPAKSAEPKVAEPSKPVKKVYTNRDLTSVDGPMPLPTVPAAAPAPDTDTASPSALDAMRTQAKQLFGSAVSQLAYRLRSHASTVKATASTCNSDSYRGMSRAARDQHLSYCRGRVSDDARERAGIEAVASAMEESAHAKGIYPGVMRELFASIGWTR